MSLFAFTKTLWKKAFGFFLQRFPSNQKAYLAKNSESIAINIFFPRQFGESTQNNLNLDQVLEVVQHYLVNKKASPVLTHIKTALLANIGIYQHTFTEQFFSSHQFWSNLEIVLFNSSLLSNDILNLSDFETRQKLQKLALMLAPNSFSADLKVAIAKQFSGLADLILFNSEINSNLTLEHKKQIIRFYLTPGERIKPSNSVFIEKLRTKKLYLDAYDNQSLAELYISGGLLTPEEIALTALLHSVDFLNQQWNTVKNTLLKNDKTGQETRTEFFWGLETAFLQLPTYQPKLNQQAQWLRLNAANDQTAEYKSAQLAYTTEKQKYDEAKAVFERALLLIHNCELVNYLPPNLKAHANKLQFSLQANLPSPSSALSDRNNHSSSESSNQKLDDSSEVSLSSGRSSPGTSKKNDSDKVKAEQEKLLNEIMHALLLLGSVKNNGIDAIIAELCTLRSTDRHAGITDQALFALAINPDYPEIAQAALHFICDTHLIGTHSGIKSFDQDTLGKIFIHYKDDITTINKIFNYLRECKKHITNSGLANNQVSNNISAAYQLAHENKAFAEALFSNHENASILLNKYGIVKTAISLGKKHGQYFLRKHILTLAESATKNSHEKQ